MRGEPEQGGGDTRCRLPAGAYLAWLDQVYPMFSELALKPEAVIGIVGRTKSPASRADDISPRLTGAMIVTAHHNTATRRQVSLCAASTALMISATDGTS